MYRKPRQLESELHLQVANHLKIHYPDVIFRTDFAAGIKMTIGQAKKHKSLQQGSAYPDLFIAQPRGRKYHGLYIELKHPEGGHQPFLKDGITPSNDKHCVEQRNTLEKLSGLGYYARFAVGIDQARLIIDWYLRNDPSLPEPTVVAMAAIKKEANEYETTF